MRMQRRGLLGASFAAGLAGARPSSAQGAYPNRPIRIVVPFAPGGNVDLQCRVLAERVGQMLRTSIVVENRTGAGGAVGAEMVARSAPDGYTLLGGSNGPMTVSPAIRANSPYDPTKDFAPIILTSRVPMVIAISRRMPVTNLQEFVAYAKANPGKVTFASSGTGSSSHLVIIGFGMATGTEYVHVPYRGASATVPDLIAGTVDAVMTEVPNIAAAHQQGQVRIIGVAAANRSPLVPEVPTFAQAGVPNFNAFSFCGLLAPAQTPAPIVEVLNRGVAAALGEAEIRKKFEDMALEIPEPSDMTPAAFGSMLERELADARRIAAVARIEL